MNKSDLAVEFKHNGCNCCQAVLCAFAKECGLEEAFLKRLGAGFGAGMGGMEGTCGALVAVEMLLGLRKYAGAPVMGEARRLHQAFTEACGASLCKDLKGRDTGRPLCDCDTCVRNAAALTEGLFTDGR